MPGEIDEFDFDPWKNDYSNLPLQSQNSNYFSKLRGGNDIRMDPNIASSDTLGR